MKIKLSATLLLSFLAVLTFVSHVSIASPSMDEVSEQYVKLVLAMGEHDPNYVDAYYGPKEWQQAAKQNKIKLDNIIKAADHLVNFLKERKTKNEIKDLRISYLKIQLASLKARAVMIKNGKMPSFDEQSRLLYDTEAPHIKLTDFDETLKRLEKLLPGKGLLAERANRFKDKFIIPRDKLDAVFNVAIKECRNRTRVFIDLLENENFTLEYVKDKPWSGYNWYKGNSFSLIQINEELPIYLSRAIDLGCHEGYPGHHTYNALLEANLVNKRGWKEFTVYPLFSPQSLIAEGSANYGIEMAFPGNEKIEFEKKVLFPLAGINPSLAEKYSVFAELVDQLRYADNELARRYLNGEIDSGKAAELFQKYTLASEQKAKQRIRFWDTYGAYVINYTWGKDLVKNWVESGKDQSKKGRWKRFSQLLSSPRLPSTL